ncbi:Heat shock transcription factor [Wickerhamiella sorbophila]|uniref:Heat shock transcription factor n=1 Tax=Wickerhamiella sorbophila TaxID=45607 RepID=A0A2T0FPR4_9ASCO|nr:Heat shock transcription factor [Wickerhamiella sorbophila]PRT56978.1 Heat shock transcription factor [Wickerhamiella sorbophila]
MPAADTKVPPAPATRSRRAPVASSKNRPAFVSKLWKMVNDPKNGEYIRWMPDGKSIQVVNREAFEKNVLPKHFKHSNFSSFVRQLNMYGWHKVQDVNSGSMHSNDEHWQFQSPNFIKDREDLLDNIVRNKGKHSEEDEEQQLELSKVLSELEQIKSRQIAIGEDLSRIQSDNELLWNEYYSTRELYEKHSQMLERIVRFLANMYGADGKLLDMFGGGQIPISHRLLMGSDPVNQFNLSTSDRASPQVQQLQELQDMQSRIHQSGVSTAKTSPSPSSDTPPSDFSKALIPSTRTRPLGGFTAPPVPPLNNGLPPNLETSTNGLAIPLSPSEIRRPSSSKLEELEADLANQGNSLKEVQELIQRISPSFGLNDELDPNFDVNDFLVNSPLNDGTVGTIPALDNVAYDDNAKAEDELANPAGYEVDSETAPPAKKSKRS